MLITLKQFRHSGGIELICSCGQPFATRDYVIRQYDNNGHVIYEVCPHGITVVDTRDTYERMEAEHIEYNERLMEQMELDAVRDILGHDKD